MTISSRLSTSSLAGRPARRVATALVAAATSIAPLLAMDGLPFAVGTIGFNLGGDLADTGKAVAVQPDGKVVYAGTAASGPAAWNVVLARRLPNGAMDTAFDVDGMLTNLSTASGGSGVALRLLAGGKILVAWTIDDPVAGDHDFVVARLFADGSVDTSFGILGFTIVPFDAGGANHDDLQAMTLDGAGRILLAGSADVAEGDRDFAAARLTSAGVLDPSFGVGGRTLVTAVPNSTSLDIGRAVAVDSWGRIVVAGSTKQYPYGFDMAVVRLLSNGSRDPDFALGAAFIMSSNDPTWDDHLYAVAVQPDDKIVAAGARAVGAGHWVWAVVRLLASSADGTWAGHIDPTFGAGSGVTVGTFACDISTTDCVNRDFARALALQSNGKVVLAGSARVLHDSGLENDDFGVARLQADGKPDPAFGLSGHGAATFDAGGGVFRHDNAYALAFAPDGTIVVAGAGEAYDLDINFAEVHFSNADLFADGFDGGTAASWSSVSGPPRP